jgi:hypothetical protein
MTKQLVTPRNPRSSIRLRPLSLLPAFVLGLSLGGLGLGACVVPNPDHCFNLAIDANAWCAAVSPDRPYCSPCAADNNGCVAQEPDPDDCPAYTAPAESGTAGTETDTGTETSTGTETDTGTETETETSG